MAEDTQKLLRQQDDIRRKLRLAEKRITSLEQSADRVLETYYMPVTARNSNILLNGGIRQIALGASVTPGSPVTTPSDMDETHLLIVVNTLGVTGTAQITGTSYSYFDSTTNPFAQEDIAIDTVTTDTSTTSLVGIFEPKFVNAYMTKLSWQSAVTITSDGTLNMANIDLYQVLLIGAVSPGAALVGTQVTGESNDNVAALDLVTAAYDFGPGGQGDVASATLSVLAGTAITADAFGRGSIYNLTYPRLAAAVGGFGGHNVMLGVLPTNKDAFFNVTVTVLSNKPTGSPDLTQL